MRDGADTMRTRNTEEREHNKDGKDDGEIRHEVGKGYISKNSLITLRTHTKQEHRSLYILEQLILHTITLQHCVCSSKSVE